MNQVYLAFIAGFTNGGISCSTLQGGLLASSLARSNSKFKNISLFLFSKIVIHTILGVLLGLFGSSLLFSLKLQGTIQIVISFYMLATAGRILNLHPIFNLTSFNLPIKLDKYLEKLSGKYPNIRPILLGAATIFIPCGVTQAVAIWAIGSSSPINGGLIMFAFVLGTTPIFFAVGMALNGIFRYNLLTKFAGLLFLALGLLSINNGQVLRGSLHTFQNYKTVLLGDNTNFDNQAKVVNGIQEIEIEATNNGYYTNTKTIKIDVPVKITVVSNNVVTCARSFAIPALGINKLLPATGTETIEFTPKELGFLNFSCGMGMYTGSFNVVK